jgi:hypothetical protein
MTVSAEGALENNCINCVSSPAKERVKKLKVLILKRPPTEVGLARLRQREGVEIGNGRFRWAAVSKDGNRQC